MGGLISCIIIKKNGEQSIYKNSNKNGYKETISLRDSLNFVFIKNNGIKKNISKIADLRDHAVHLLMPEIQGIASRLFQSGIFNYSSKFEEICEVPFLNTDNTGMISLVGDFKTPALPMMSSIYGKAAEDIISIAENLTQTVENTNDLSFAIPLNVTLQFAKKDSQGTQIILTQAQDGMTGLKEALVIEKNVDAERTHIYKQNQAIIEINKKLHEKYDDKYLRERLKRQSNNKYQLNKNCFQSMVHKLKWKQSNNKFHHHLASANTHIYSDHAVDEIIDKITNNKNYLHQAKESFSNR